MYNHLASENNFQNSLYQNGLQSAEKQDPGDPHFFSYKSPTATQYTIVKCFCPKLDIYFIFWTFILFPFITMVIPAAGKVKIVPPGSKGSLETPINIWRRETLGPGLMTCNNSKAQSWTFRNYILVKICFSIGKFTREVGYQKCPIIQLFRLMTSDMNI